MGAELTKAFAFSASYSVGTRSLGRNYMLSITVEALDEKREAEFEALVQERLISSLHTRDLSQVDYLKGITITDAALLEAFRKRLTGPLAAYKLRRMALRRDSRTVTTLSL